MPEYRRNLVAGGTYFLALANRQSNLLRREIGSAGCGSVPSENTRVHDGAEFTRHIDIVHFDPVKHGLAANAVDRPCSSFDQAVMRSLYTANSASDWILCDGVLKCTLPTLVGRA